MQGIGGEGTYWTSCFEGKTRSKDMESAGKSKLPWFSRANVWLTEYKRSEHDTVLWDQSKTWLVTDRSLGLFKKNLTFIFFHANFHREQLFSLPLLVSFFSDQQHDPSLLTASEGFFQSGWYEITLLTFSGRAFFLSFCPILCLSLLALEERLWQISDQQRERANPQHRQA